MIATLAVALALDTALRLEPLPGEYVGPWPMDASNEALWTKVEAGLLVALAQPVPENTTPFAALLPSLFADGEHACGAFMGRRNGQDIYSVHAFIVRLPTGAGLREGGDLPVRMLNRDAGLSEMVAACPNMPDEDRHSRPGSGT